MQDEVHSNSGASGDSDIASPAYVEVRDQYNEPRFHHLEHVFANLTATNASVDNDDDARPGRNVSQTQRQRCKEFCRCKCHRQKKSIRSWQLSTFAKSLGFFVFGFTSPLFADDCDTTACAFVKSKWAAVTYTFPSWLFHATIVTLFSNLNGSPEIILRVHRRIPREELHRGSIFGHIASGDIDKAKDLLRRKAGLVTDVKAHNGETVLHAAFNFLQSDLDMMRLLVQEGADWFQGKDNGHQPCMYLLCIPT